MKYLLIIVATFFLFISCGKHEYIKGENDTISLNSLNGDALIIATTNGNYTDVKKFLEEGTDPDTVDDRDRSLLMIAVSGKKYVIVDLLIKNGADPDWANEEGKTVYDQFNPSDDPFMIKILQDNSSLINDDWEGYILKLVKETNNDNVTAKTEEMATLFEAGVSPNTADRRGSLLFYACNSAVYDLVEFLITSDGIDINLVIRGHTALDRTRSAAIKELLIAHGAKSAKDL